MGVALGAGGTVISGGWLPAGGAPPVVPPGPVMVPVPQARAIRARAPASRRVSTRKHARIATPRGERGHPSHRVRWDRCRTRAGCYLAPVTAPAPKRIAGLTD